MILRYLRNRIFLRNHRAECERTKRAGDRTAYKRAVARKMRKELGLPDDPRLSAR